MRIDKNSYGTVALVWLIALAIVLPLILCHCSLWAIVPTLVVVLPVAVWQTLFHRVPVRQAAGSDKVVTAVADGQCVIIDKVYEPEWLKRDCIQVSIYMDFWDVHANFWPVTGEVTYYKYHPGKHLLAFKPKASEDNEHTCIGLRTPSGTDVFFKQLAGTFARRIVCYAEPGLQVRAGEQCGIIKFGSRIDMYLPLDADIKIGLKEFSRACETVIANID